MLTNLYSELVKSLRPTDIVQGSTESAAIWVLNFDKIRLAFLSFTFIHAFMPYSLLQSIHYLNPFLCIATKSSPSGSCKALTAGSAWSL